MGGERSAQCKGGVGEGLGVGGFKERRVGDSSDRWLSEEVGRGGVMGGRRGRLDGAQESH